MAEGGIVEDDPGVGVVERGGKVGQEGRGIVGVVGAGGAVEAVVAKIRRAAGGRGEGRGFGWVGGDAGDGEVAEEAIGGGSEPGGVARFEGGRGGVELAEGGEEFVGEAFVVGEGGWELDQEWAEFVAKAGGLVEERLEVCAGVGEPGGVGDGLGELDGEAEVSGSGGGPAFPGFVLVGAVEAGVDFGAVEGVGVAVEVG